MHPQPSSVSDQIHNIEQRPDIERVTSRIEELLHRPTLGLQPGDHAIPVLDLAVAYLVSGIQAGSKLVRIVGHNLQMSVCVAFVHDGFLEDVEFVEVAQYSFHIGHI